MWEAIARNRFRSRFLILLMGILLLGLGFAIGMVVEPKSGGLIGIGIALVLWFILTLTAIFQGDSLLLQTAGAREIGKEDCPVLWNVVEEMTIASGMGKMPRVYIIADGAPNAFAVGRRPENSAIAVTAGLVAKLNRDELQGVVAHEMGHIHNLDIRFMTIASVMLGVIVLISEIFLRSLYYSGRGRSRRSSKGEGQAQLVIFVIALLMAILAPIMAQILYFACSRKREYLADASAAKFTRYPAGLASALEKISKNTIGLKNTSKALAPLYIVNPLKGMAAVGLFSTHPPTAERISILRSMAGGAGYADYEAAFRKVARKESGLIGKTALAEGTLQAREAAPGPEDLKSKIEQIGKLSDLMGSIGGLLLLHCDCGMGIQLPPAYQKETIDCPRCGKTLDVPAAAVKPVPKVQRTSVATKTSQPMDNLSYERKGDGWQTFRCSCGNTLQLSPRFGAPFIKCGKCKSKIAVQ